MESRHSACTIVLRGGSESELELVEKALSFALHASRHLCFENAFLRDTLSIATETSVTFGVQGLSSEDSLESWKPICKQIVQQSTHLTRLQRPNDACIDFISPHMSTWTTNQTHDPFKQKKEFSDPVYIAEVIESEPVTDPVSCESTESVTSKISEEYLDPPRNSTISHESTNMDALIHASTKESLQVAQNKGNVQNLCFRHFRNRVP